MKNQAFAIIGAFGALAFAPALALAAPVGPTQDAKLEAGPAGVYSRTCGYCHGSNVGPVILGRHLPEPVIKQFVRSGLGAMPAFRQTEIDDAQLTALARWIAASEANPNEHGR